MALCREADKLGEGEQLIAKSSNSQAGAMEGPARQGTTFPKTHGYGGNTHWKEARATSGAYHDCARHLGATSNTRARGKDSRRKHST